MIAVRRDIETSETLLRSRSRTRQRLCFDQSPRLIRPPSINALSPARTHDLKRLQCASARPRSAGLPHPPIGHQPSAIGHRPSPTAHARIHTSHATQPAFLTLAANGRTAAPSRTKCLCAYSTSLTTSKRRSQPHQRHLRRL